jgi:aspartyl-tRNA(Asn)/glutamyl-tRNA(Gln) amidotransferase subunit A
MTAEQNAEPRFPPFQGIRLRSARIRQGDLTCEDSVAESLERIDRLDPVVHAFTHVAHEQAMDTARGLDLAKAARSAVSPLAGLPVAVKELFAVDGQPTGDGTRIDISDLVPPQGPFIKRLRDAGAVIVGKTVCTEFALSYQNLKLPTPLNPLYPDHPYTPGGSSSGSAVAVAAGMCAFAIGSDTGGSIRVPAAFCGVTGFKPGSEFWPRDGMIPLSRELDTIGIITRTPEDLVDVVGAMGDGAIPRPALNTLRLSIPDKPFFDNLAPEVSDAVGHAINHLARKGAQLTKVIVPAFNILDGYAATVNSASLVRFLGTDRVEANFDLADPMTQRRFSTGLTIDRGVVQSMVEARRNLASRINSNFGHIDAMITPTMPSLPVPLDSFADVDAIAAWQGAMAQNVRFANLFNMAAVTIPLRGPHPVGLQLMAASGNELKLVGIAAVVQQVLDGM